MTDEYPRETKEYIHPVVTVDGAGVTANVKIAVIPDDGTTRPTVWATPEIIGGKLAVLIEGKTPGYYRVFAQVTDTPEIPVIDCGIFRVT